MKVVVIMVIICVVLLFIVAAAPRIIQNIRYEDFTISGTVVDAEGQPLNDVGVAITTGRKIKMGWESDSHTTFDRINGSFEYSFNNYSNVMLWIFKSGFAEQRLQWSKGGKYPDTVVVLKRAVTTTQPQME